MHTFLYALLLSSSVQANAQQIPRAIAVYDTLEDCMEIAQIISAHSPTLQAHCEEIEE